jgi:cyclic pyranopterin phosphate synthase
MGAIRRVEINLGWACNNDCVFCGEQERREISRDVGRFRIPGEQVKADLLRYRRAGYNHVTFLGGEPTIRKDLVELVKLARMLGFRNVFVTTNGRRIADRAFLRTLLQAGLTDVCVSVHGPDAATHDALTRRAGSFAQAAAALANLAAEGHPFHTSTVVTTPNAPRLAETVRFLHGFRPVHVYLALPNPSGGAYREFTRLYPTFAEVAPHVHAAIDAARALDQLLTVSKLPLCHLTGREGYADDLFWAAAQRRSINPQVQDEIEQRFADRTAHALACRGCRFRTVCEGVESLYLQRRGTDELVPVPGPLVTDVSELRATGPRDTTAGSFHLTGGDVGAAGPRARAEAACLEHVVEAASGDGREGAP